MRVLFGIVLGAILTVGAAYYRDSTYTSPGAAFPARPLVNWDVAGEVADDMTTTVRRGLDRLMSQ